MRDGYLEYAVGSHIVRKPPELLGLVEVQLAEAATSTESASGEAPSAPTNPWSAKVVDDAINKDLYPASLQKRHPGQFPVDLQRLLSLGFENF